MEITENKKRQEDSQKPTHGLCVYERKTRQVVKSRYGKIDYFMAVEMSPNRQIEVSEKRQDFMLGEYPTLNDVALAYGRTAPIQWLIAQLTNLSEFCGVKDKLTGDQTEELAWLLKGQYGYYKVTQFLVFFHDFKLGRFGKFFGAVDPLVITSAIKEFDKERAMLLSKLEREEEDKRLREDAKNALSGEEVAKLLGDLSKKQEENVMRPELLNQARAIESNLYGVPERVLENYRSLFKKNNGLTPLEYIEKYAQS